MTSYYRKQFDSLRGLITSLTQEQYESVITYLVDSVEDFIDQDGSNPNNGKYYYHSAVESCKDKFNLKTEENEADIDLLAFEFSMFM